MRNDVNVVSKIKEEQGQKGKNTDKSEEEQDPNNFQLKTECPLVMRKRCGVVQHNKTGKIE